MTNPTLLGTGGHAAGGESYSGNYYANVGLGRSPMKGGPFTTESYVSQTIRVPGTISYLSWRLDAAFGAALTLTLNKNSSTTALAVSIPAASTGWMTDSTHSVSVSSGDKLDFDANAGTGSPVYSHSFYCISARFDANTGSAQMLVAVGKNSISPSIVPQFVNFLGIVGGASATESDKQFKALAAGAWQNMACYVESNGFTQTTTVTNRKNGSDGSMAISIPTGMSGGFEALAVHSDSVNVGDLLDYGFVASGGTGSFEVDWIGAHFRATTTTLCMIGGSPDSPSRIPSLLNPTESTYYSSLFGGGNPAPPTPRATGLLPYALNASKYTNYVTATDGAGSATFTLLKNGSASALAVASGAGETGYLTDNVDTVGFVVGDTCANGIVLTSDLTNSYIVWAGAALLLQALTP